TSRCPLHAIHGAFLRYVHAARCISATFRVATATLARFARSPSITKKFPDQPRRSLMGRIPSPSIPPLPAAVETTDVPGSSSRGDGSPSLPVIVAACFDRLALRQRARMLGRLLA